MCLLQTKRSLPEKSISDKLNQKDILSINGIICQLCNTVDDQSHRERKHAKRNNDGDYKFIIVLKHIFQNGQSDFGKFEFGESIYIISGNKWRNEKEY